MTLRTLLPGFAPAPRAWVGAAFLTLLCTALLVPSTAWSQAPNPVATAQVMVDEGDALIAKSEKRRSRKKKPQLLADGLKKYSRAYLMLTTRKLQNDAPELLQKISNKIASTNKLPLVANMRRELLTKAIDASIEGKLTEAYDHLASLRDLDPREWTVEYALGVLGQRMEGG